MCKTLGYRVIAITSDDRDALAGRPELDRMYSSRASAERAARRLGRTVVERICDCPWPSASDAAGWDAYRLAHGVGLVHH